MRKKGTIFLVLFVFLFSGCSSVGQNRYPTDDIYHFETDAQYSCFTANHQRMMAESEEGYYFAFTINNLRNMFFIDKETMETLPLCSKPNCIHYEESDIERRSLCQAYFTGTVGGPSLYYKNGKLLIPEYGDKASDYNITELALDGSSRKTVLSMEDATNGCDFLFHRGYAYAIINRYDEDMNSTMELRRYSLSRPEREPKVLFTMNAETGFMTNLLAYGQRLYFSANVGGVEQLYTVSLSTLECKPLFEGITVEWPTLMICQNQLYLLMIHPVPGRETHEYESTLYSANLDGSNLQKCWNSGTCEMTADDCYIYEWPFGMYINRMEEPYFRIRDPEGNLLVEYDPREDGINSYYTVYVMPGEHVFIFGNNRTIHYFSKSEIETGEIHPKLLIDCSQYR